MFVSPKYSKVGNDVEVTGEIEVQWVKNKVRQKKNRTLAWTGKTRTHGHPQGKKGKKETANTGIGTRGGARCWRYGPKKEP